MSVKHMTVEEFITLLDLASKHEYAWVRAAAQEVRVLFRKGRAQEAGAKLLAILHHLPVAD